MVVALWGIESNYGTRLGDFEVVPALATLAYNNFRAKFFREQLIAALQHRVAGPYRPARHEGLVGGRDGPVPVHPDQLPGLRRRWRRRRPHGHLGQQGRRLRLDRELPVRVGWRPGLEWGGEVSPGTPAGKGERIVRPAGAQGPAFRTTENFRAILRWNQSDFFGLAVGLLSDRIAN
jgi:membrane-bound lytic murein transglycosylase B